MSDRSYPLALLILTAAIAGPAPGNDFDLEARTIDCGSATDSTHADFELSGATGQPDVEITTGDNSELTGGIWAAAGGGLVPAATLVGAGSLKTHGQGLGMQDIPIDIGGHVQNRDVSTEPRAGGLTELRLVFDVELEPTDADPLTIEEQVCPGGDQFHYVPYSGSSVVDGERHGEELLVTFTPGLENARTYRFTVSPNVTTITGQSFEIRVLEADASGDGRVNAQDRSAVVAAWTDPAHFSIHTDIDLSGRTNALDRSAVVAAWTDGAQNCAP